MEDMEAFIPISIIFGAAYVIISLIFMVKGIQYFGRTKDTITENFHQAKICEQLDDTAGARKHYQAVVYFSLLRSLSALSDEQSGYFKQAQKALKDKK